MITRISAFNYGLNTANNVIFKGKEPKMSMAQLCNVQDISDQKVGYKRIVTFNDPEFKDLKLLITPETTCNIGNFPLNVNFTPGSDPSSPSFRGQVYGSIGNNDKGKGMARAYDEFFIKGMNTAVEKPVAANQIKDNYNFYIPSDGDGTRYKDITALQGGMTKPASFIPAKLNNEPMRLIHGVLVNFAKTGKLEDSPQFIEVEPAKGSAYAFLEGLRTGQIPTDKPIVFSWGDNFSDIDVTKMILEHEKERGEEGNSGLTLMAVPVGLETAVGYATLRFDNFENLVIEDLIEKPKKEVAETYKAPELDGEIPCSVAPYILSAQVLKWIKENYTQEPEKFLNEKGYDFSSKILTPLVEEFNNGTFKDENGQPLKMRAKLLDKSETMSDLGAQKDFSFEMYRIKAGEGYANMLPEITESIRKNVDENKNISFNDKSRELLARLQEKYNLTFKKVIAWAS